MGTLKISNSLEDYIEAIAEIIEANGHAHAKDIAEKLKVKMPSVTNALQALSSQGLVSYQPHYPVELTPTGKRLGAEIIRRHKVLEKFFRDILKIAPEEAGKTACKIEHLVSGEVVDRFVVFSEAIQNRPDCEGLRKYLEETMPQVRAAVSDDLISLPELPPGKKALISRIGENVKGVKKFASLGLVNGAEIEMEGRTLLGNLLRIRILGSSLSLRASDAKNIWVTQLP